MFGALLLALTTLGNVSDFRQRDPHDGARASLATRASLSYDDQNLYADFVCHDDPKKVRARMARREDIEQDDQVVVILDTFHDRRRAYVFAANPLGIQRDGIRTEGQEDDFTFDAVWSAEGHLTPDGYTVRITIPFRSLRFPDTPQQTWGIALGRIIPRLSEESYWPYITKRVGGFVHQMATLKGLRDISPGRNLQIAPYAATAGDQRAGLDAKAVFRDAITLDLTMNPDFSQVESNEPQVTVNRRFEVFFPEKRPFFVENAGLLQTPVNLFFSRRIADPQYGMRVSGKAGAYAFGVVGANDRRDRASIGALRVQREIGKESALGVFVSGRDSDRTIAADTRLKLNEHWSLQAQAIWSGAAGLYAELKRSGRTFDYVARYTDFAPRFAVPLGFVKRADIRQIEQSAKYRWRPRKSIVTKFGPSMAILGNWDHEGVLQDWKAEGGFKVELTGRTEIEIVHAEQFERFAGHGFRKNVTELAASTEWLDWLGASASISRGSEINFKAPAGMQPFLGDASEAALTLSIIPTSRLRLDSTLLLSELNRVFSNQVARWKVSYQISPRLSIRTILDYDHVTPNAALSRLERRTLVTGDILVTYLVAPGTAAYIGYTDRRENLLEPAGQLFAKVSYLWRY